MMEALVEPISYPKSNPPDAGKMNIRKDDKTLYPPLSVIECSNDGDDDDDDVFVESNLVVSIDSGMI